jgi:hypothetical protein
MSHISRLGLALTGLLLIVPFAFAAQDAAGNAMAPAAAPAASAGPGSAPGSASGTAGEADEPAFGDAELPPYPPAMGAYGPMVPGMMMGRPWGPCWGTSGGPSGRSCPMGHPAGCPGHKHGHGDMDHVHRAFRAKYRKLMARLDVLEARMNTIQTLLERLMER